MRTVAVEAEAIVVEAAVKEAVLVVEAAVKEAVVIEATVKEAVVVEAEALVLEAEVDLMRKNNEVNQGEIGNSSKTSKIRNKTALSTKAGKR